MTHVELQTQMCTSVENLLKALNKSYPAYTCDMGLETMYTDFESIMYYHVKDLVETIEYQLNLDRQGVSKDLNKMSVCLKFIHALRPFAKFYNLNP